MILFFGLFMVQRLFQDFERRLPGVMAVVAVNMRGNGEPYNLLE